jgi:signal transduction histidine kinase
MPLRKRRGKTLIIALTIISVTVLPYTQYRVYLNTVKVTRQQLHLNSLRSQVIYLDGALAIASGSFVLTKDSQWQKYYKALQENFNTCLSGINQLLPNGYEGKQELMNSHQFLMHMEEKAFLLVRSGQTNAAQKLLVGNDYLTEKGLFSAAMKKLIHRLDGENDNLFVFLRKEAIKNILVRGVIVLMLLLGWLWFSKLNKQWKRKLKELDQQRASEERAAAKKLEQVNGQLRELSIYLQDVREKERMSLAYEINEQLGQQIAAVKIRIAEIRRAQNASDEPGQVELEDIAFQLDRILNQIRNLATEVYPLILRDLGLPEALQWESERVASQSGAVVMFTSGVEDINLDHRTNTTLFRTYQYKLQNCLSQGATEIISNLHLGKDVLFLSIHDDGIMTSNDGTDVMEDMALRERLQSIKGHCQTNNTTNAGNRFTISIPYTMQ